MFNTNTPNIKKTTENPILITDEMSEEYLRMPLERKCFIPHDILAEDKYVQALSEEKKSKVMGLDNFNDMNKNIPRDNSNRVNTIPEIVNKFNEYDYTGSIPGQCGWWLSALCSCSLTYWTSRHIVSAGNFGVYESAGRYLLLPSGIHVLKSLSERFIMQIPIDADDDPKKDGNELKRTFGSKTLLIVPENYIAGGFRIGRANDESEDGEFVLFGQGRHVIDEVHYRNIQIKPLEKVLPDDEEKANHYFDKDIIRIGPITVLYVKEGYIGCAYERNLGRYILLYPGPPYLLHQQDYQEICKAKRTLKRFTLGPFEYVIVKEGELGGAFNKIDGKYQLLPPGNSYCLHSKTYEDIRVVPRSDLFELGPFTFLTVHKGWIAGCYLKRGGEWLDLPPGHTYQLNKEFFQKPELVKKDSLKIQCGPLTYLSVGQGQMAGAYRTSDGVFEEFEEGKAYPPFHALHYHSWEIIAEKYKTEPQKFGPSQIVTIPDGFCGVFEREGKIEIVEPGFYQKSAKYNIKPNIPLKVISEHFNNLPIISKDNINMSVNISLVWQVSEPMKVALIDGYFKGLSIKVKEKAQQDFALIVRTYSRVQLLPTENEQKLLQDSDNNSKDYQQQTYSLIEKRLFDDMTKFSIDGAWGVKILTTKITGFEITDIHIYNNLKNIAENTLATQAKEFEGKLEIKKAGILRATNNERARAEADIAITQAEANSNIKVMQATQEAKAQTEAKRIQLQMQKDMADTEYEINERKMKLKIEQAEAEAKSLGLISEANYQKMMKENDAASKIPPQELQLRQMEMAVTAVKHYGAAAWKYPDEVTAFLQTIMPFLRMGPASAKEIFEEMGQAAYKKK